MELLTFVLLIIIAILLFFLLKKERVLGINTEVKIEDKKLDEDESKKYRETIYNLLNYIPEGIIILNKSKEIIFSNSSASKRFQTKLNENISGFLRNPDLLSSIEKAFNGENSNDLEIELRNPSVLRMNVTIYQDNHNLFFDEPSCLLFMRDLTEFHKFQQLKSDFVANVSHELRTPLQSIKMGLETFENNADLKKNSEVTNLLPVMTSQSERMENLIRDLLSLSKIELQEHIRPTHEIDLIEVLSYVIKTYENIVKKNNINLNLQKTENFKIIGDRDKLIEIFTNLIDNSIKYSKPNSVIQIFSNLGSGKLIEKHHVISIKDQGIGIPREDINRVTERFYRVDINKSRNAGGTGLGLAIMKHIITQHRGDYEILSELDKGTEIKIYLPTN